MKGRAVFLARHPACSVAMPISSNIPIPAKVKASSEESRSGVREGLKLCLFLGCMGGLADVFLSMFLFPLGLSRPKSLLSVFATGSWAVFLVAAALFLVMGPVLRRRSVASHLAVAGFLGVLMSGLVMLRTGHAMLTPQWDPMPGYATVAGLLLVVVAAGLAGWIGWKFQDVMIQFGALGVVFGMTTVGVVWALSFHASSPFSPVGAVSIAVQLGVCGLMIRWIRRPALLERRTRLIGLTLPLFLTGCLALIGLHPKASGRWMKDDMFKTVREENSPTCGKVVLISIDTLRADHLSCMGEREIKTPAMDGLAREGILFERCIAAAPWTRPSVTSMMTGLPVEAHRVDSLLRGLPDGIGTLAEGYQRRGHLTAMIGDNIQLAPESGLDRGFVEYNQFPRLLDELGHSAGAALLRRLFPERFLAEPDTDELARLAVRWLRLNHRKDFFLWFHLFTPHTPLTPPRRLIDPQGYDDLVGFRFDPETEDRPPIPLSDHLTPHAKAWVSDLYKAEVRHTDEAVAKVVECLRELGILDETLVVLTADHGESFWEHGRFGHANSLYDELLHVPLIVKLPGSAYAGTVVSEEVPSLAVFSTLNQLSGLGMATPYPFGGSLDVFWSQAAADFPPIPIVSESVTLPLELDDRCMVLDDAKFVIPEGEAAPYVFDHEQDPEEKTPLTAESHPDWPRARELFKMHDEASAAIRVVAGQNRQLELSDETRERLEDLGYLE